MAAQTPSNEQRGDAGFFEHFLAKKGKKIEIYAKIFEANTGVKLDRGKTIGTITRKNDDTVLMCAVSGYSAGAKEDPLSPCLDTKKWNRLCLHHLAKQIKFRFPGNIRDTSGGPILDEFRGRAQVCLQFLNKLSQYTEVLFLVVGSCGIGPIQVRVEGERRLDIVGDVFVDSEDESPEEANMLLDEVAGLQDAHRDGAASEIPAPSTPPPPPPVLRRPGSSWKYVPTPWTPINAEALVSAYRKKTPVYEFPGYDLALAKEDAGSEDQWEDMGDGVCK
ncbi:hypothetical protein EKO27_g4450 [Xylaria grammica]|uniref:Uncharacterized protein n=1 Tax=Xylaria grammica TaxID=363999 RepID=A0A439D8C7_9PEZI|nr:hypothetical protein EKO27_g4450 [Xylaria grammica]